MKEFISPSKYYRLLIPEDWSYIQEDNLASFYDEENGVGSLQISSYLIPKDYDFSISSELSEIISERTGGNKDDILSNIEISENMGHYHIIINDRYWKYYMVFDKGKMFFITYNASENESAIEKKVLVQIIQSIKII